MHGKGPHEEFILYLDTISHVGRHVFASGVGRKNFNHGVRESVIRFPTALVQVTLAYSSLPQDAFA